MDFTKMHGLGNDFIIVNNMEQKLDPAFMARMAPQLCHRNFGIGADGLVLLDVSNQAPFRMRIFNPDGSEPEMCGNAIRCLAKYVWDRGLCKEPGFAFETAAGNKEVRLLINGSTVEAVRVDMGSPVLESEKIPLAGPPRQALDEKVIVDQEELYFTAVNMGNPHCVIFLPDIENVPWKSWGAILEQHPVFPQKTNVEFVDIQDPQQIKVKVWERGAGPTLACGTGACASVVAGVLTGRLLNDVEVILPGGALKITWNKGGNVFMEGPAEEVFSGKIKI